MENHPRVLNSKAYASRRKRLIHDTDIERAMPKWLCLFGWYRGKLYLLVPYGDGKVFYFVQLRRLSNLSHCTSLRTRRLRIYFYMEVIKMDYKDTLLMPKTEFPMRGNLPKKEPEIQAHWN